MSWMPKDSLVGKLRQLRPEYLLVTTDNTDEPAVRINLPNIRQRFQRALDTLNELPWQRIELYDKKNGLLATHTRTAADEQAATELETLTPSRGSSETAAMLGLMLKAQDTVLSKYVAILHPMFEAQFKIINVAFARLERLEEQNKRTARDNAKMTHDLATAAARLTAVASGGDEGDDDSVSGSALAPMLPAMLQAMLTPNERKDADDERPRKPKRTTPKDERERPASNGVHATHPDSE